MTVEIKPMKFCHVEQVSEIETAVFPTPWSQHTFVNEVLSNGFASYYVALSKEMVIGYAGIWIILDEAHITTLAVSPEWQHHGVGRQLLDHIIAEAVKKGAIRMTLEVRVSNEKAQELYKKYGFIPCGLRPNYYSNEDAMIMWLENLPAANSQQTANGQS